MSIDINLRQRVVAASQSHWRQFSDPLDSDRINDYIQNVLPLELECARSDEDEPRRLPSQDKQGGVLVLLVGFSIDPLLQAICAYKPNEVILVLNSRYSEPPEGWTGQEFGNYIASFFPQLASNHLINNQISRNNGNVEFVILDRDHPADVFRKLREVLIPRLHGGERLVLDITGGKKSMVTGAFLFGAFAGVDISYVDFDEYDPQNRVPRGYTCRIGILPNPYETFRLRDWDRVRELYERYLFRNAATLLDEIIPSMRGWFSEDEVNASKLLRKVMKMYEYWDNGDHCGALKMYESIRNQLKASLQLPTAVWILGEDDYWPHSEDAETLLAQLKKLEYGEDGRPSLYLSVKKLLVYAYDELAKVERLIEHNEDYRSALLRAVGLTEVLLRARLLILIHTGKVEIAIKPEKSTSPDYQLLTDAPSEVTDWRQIIVERVIEQQSVYPFIRALQYRADGSADERRPTKLRCTKGTSPNQEENEFLLRRTSEAPLLSGDVLLGKETKLRNKAIHTYLSVPENIARRALDIVRKSVNEFAKKWAVLIMKEKVEVQTELVGWTELCRACGITFLPPSKEETQ